MPAFGIVLILVGIFVLINLFNGNLVNLVQGKIAFNFTPQTLSTDPGHTVALNPPGSGSIHPAI